MLYNVSGLVPLEATSPPTTVAKMTKQINMWQIPNNNTSPDGYSANINESDSAEERPLKYLW